MIHKDVMLRTCALATIAVLLNVLPATGWADNVQYEEASSSASPLLLESQRLLEESIAVRDEAIRLSATIQANAARRRATDDGIALSANFSVSAPPGDFLADDVLAAAERYRREIALEWLGRELPAGDDRTFLLVELSDAIDEGLTLLDGGRKDFRNRIWLRTSAERAVGTTLAHEIAHVVLSARFPIGMPVWATEGVSSQYDDDTRIARRRVLLDRFAQSGHWPSIHRLLEVDSISPTDEHSYATAVSLTDYLIADRDRETFLEFVAAGRDDDWDSALRQHYDIDSTEELTLRWQTWVVDRATAHSTGNGGVTLWRSKS